MKDRLDPNEHKLNAIQVKRLSALTGVEPERLHERSVGELAHELRWLIDPRFFFFERVCGQVVKVDPATGLKYPVANATVEVRDVDCDWFWFSPPAWRWSWAFPFGFCRSETLTETTTDACGNFCVWIPRFDIDWLLTWRKERICLPEVLRRPNIGDVLTATLPKPGPGDPNPPDPVATARRFGASTGRLNAALRSPAFASAVQPPIPAELRALAQPDAHQAIAESMTISSRREGMLDLTRYYGPFERCFDIEVPEWMPLFEVPDIVFVVTQDTGGGVTEVIYDGAFDVDWAGPMDHVELDASPNAVASPTPGCVPGIECTTEAFIYSLGLMGVDAGYLDTASGFALLMNQPAPTPPSTVAPLSTAPFAGGIQVYACTPVEVGAYYRVLAARADSDGLTVQNPDGTMQPLPAGAFGPALPVSATWQDTLLPPASGPVDISPVDADGWYRVRSDVNPEGMVLQWEPVDGVYTLTVQMGQGVPGAIVPVAGADSPPLTVVVDNTPPTVTFEATGWRYHSDPASTSYPFADCNLIERTKGADVVVHLAYTVTAKHLFTASISQGGCGTATALGSDPLAAGWRYANPFDNSISGSVSYLVPGTAQSGCYSWTLWAHTRAFSPEDPWGPDINLASGSAWNADYAPIWVDPSVSVAIVDAGL